MSSSSGSLMHPTLPLQSLQVIIDFINHYKQAGASFVSLPWIVDPAFASATNPHPELPDRTFLDKTLVASGEQSFCELASQGKLQEEMLYVGWTPCFRTEEFFDQSHHHYFIKAEAFRLLLPHQEEDYLNAILALAQHVFEKELKRRGVHDTPKIIYLPNLEQFDIVINGIELGSYGIRSHPTLKKPYLFGTVVAEPRFSYAVFRSLHPFKVDVV